MLPKRALQKLEERIQKDAFRYLPQSSQLVDFCSNDYLGFTRDPYTSERAQELLKQTGIQGFGATGSRLLSGNHDLYRMLEVKLREVHQCEAALVFNSGYDANLGLLSSLLQRDDVILYDALCHASIRDGLRLGLAKSYKYAHNDLVQLENLLLKHTCKSTVYVITESVFSMDGDSPELDKMVALCETYGAYLIVDEAHAVGVFGYGLCQEFHIEKQVFARIVTFGKALGGHGAAVLGSNALISFLINFARSFIYTTALPPHSVAGVIASYELLERAISNSQHDGPIYRLKKLINVFRQYQNLEPSSFHWLPSSSSIQSLILPGNKEVKRFSQKLHSAGLDVRPILYPTVPMGSERLRACIHAFNSDDEIGFLFKQLKGA